VTWVMPAPSKAASPIEMASSLSQSRPLLSHFPAGQQRRAAGRS